MMALLLLLVSAPVWAACPGGKTVFSCTTKQSQFVNVCLLADRVSLTLTSQVDRRLETSVVVPLSLAASSHRPGTTNCEAGQDNHRDWLSLLSADGTAYQIFHAAGELAPHCLPGVVSAGVSATWLEQPPSPTLACDPNKPIVNLLGEIDLVSDREKWESVEQAANRRRN